MTRFGKISGVLAMLVLTGLFALFHGCFDHGQFEIKQSQRSSTNQVAMIAERSDHEALGGLVYYVVIGDHLFNSAELRGAYYSNAVVFNTSNDCLTLRWNGPDKLTIKCDRSTIEKDQINVQRQQVGNISIAYENIASK